MSVRTPVESISMRLMIGCVKMLLQPGTCSTRPISSSTRSPFGPPVRGQKNTRSRNGFSSSSRSAPNGAKAAGSCGLPSWTLHRAVGEPLGLGPACGRVEQVRGLGRLRQFLQGVPGERLGAAVEQLPVDLLDALAPQRRRARARRPASSSPASVCALAPSNSPTRRQHVGQADCVQLPVRRRRRQWRRALQAARRRPALSRVDVLQAGWLDQPAAVLAASARRPAHRSASLVLAGGPGS